MNWLNHLDTTLFHWINPRLSNGFFDIVMPWLSGNALFVPFLVITGALLVIKGGARGRICLAMIFLAVVLGDTFICNTLKQAFNRPRPFWTLADVHLPLGIGRSDSGSMPSSHAANWFAATMIAFIYYRRSIRFMLPLALLVCFSRVYNGVHYPGDVIVGAILAIGYASALVWLLDAAWRIIGARWFPLWWQQLPFLLNPNVKVPPAKLISASPQLKEQQLVRLAYTLIFAEFVGNLFYIGSRAIELSEDEAYQWVWSKHLALSYYSKPLLIAVTQYVGTYLWGDTAFGVRFFSPVIATVTAIALFQFMRRVATVRAAFWLAVITPAVPLLAVGSVLMTVDPLSVMFWILAMISGWHAVQENSHNRYWLWTGFWMGLGFLSKYTALFQLLSWAVFFLLYPPARKQLRRAGPWLALLVNLLCSIPVLIWNFQNHWITVRHVAQGGSLDKPWVFSSASVIANFFNFTMEFIGAEFALQNPFFFLAMLWAAIAFWKYKPHRPLLVYFFSMGAPVFIVYLLLTIHSRSLPNWVAPAIMPFLCLAVVYWNDRWQEGKRQTARIFIVGGLIIGALAYAVLHDFNLIPKLTGYRLPDGKNPSHRVKGWQETAETVQAARLKLQSEGKPVFIIGGHYGITSQVAFNLPEARIATATNTFVYFQTSDFPMNQYYFWPGYLNRHGENAIFVQELDFNSTNTIPFPPILYTEFAAVKDLGVVTVMQHGERTRRIQIAECRNLK